MTLLNHRLLGTWNSGLAEVQYPPDFQRQGRGRFLSLVAPIGSEKYEFLPKNAKCLTNIRCLD